MLHPRPTFTVRIEGDERGFPIRIPLDPADGAGQSSRDDGVPTPTDQTNHFLPIPKVQSSPKDPILACGVDESHSPAPHLEIPPDPAELPDITLNRQQTQKEAHPTKSTSSAIETAGYEYTIVDGDVQTVIAGERKPFEDCEDEQIHTPGAIQSFGALIALACTPDHKLDVRMVSENSQEVLHYSVKDIFRLNSFLDVLVDASRAEFEARAWNVRELAKKATANPDPTVFTMAVQTPEGTVVPLCCAMHFVDDGRDLVICEFEEEHRIDTSPSLPEHPVNTLDKTRPVVANLPQEVAPTGKASLANTLLSPLGQRRMEGLGLVATIANIQSQFSSAKTIEELGDNIVDSVQKLTKFHRVMVYRFDLASNGSVMAEAIDPRASGDSYKNLRFPASDIPVQARKLYMINKVRYLFDREAPTSRLVCRSVNDLEPALDLTHSYLRAMSPIHIKYLTNMGVRSTMSISLELDGKLWGLICCHSYGKATGLPFPIREVCFWIALCASTCLEKLNYSAKLESRRVLEALQTKKNPQTCVTASSEDILKLFNATSGFMVIQGEARSVGRHTIYQEALTLLRYVSMRRFTTIIACQNISVDYPSLQRIQTLKSIAGFLFIPLSTANNDFLVVLRDHQIREVHWAGKPRSKLGVDSPVNKLEPRHSFAKWTEEIKGFCESWNEEEKGHFATMVQLVYGNFIEVWRQERTIAQTRLKRALLLNASHEVRTPLNAIINYLEIALEKPLDEDTKDVLRKSHSASKSLVYVIDDLLSLSTAQEKHFSLLESAFDIKASILEAIDPLSAHARAKGLSFEVINHNDLPNLVKGDVHRFQQVLIQIVSNAIQFTPKGGVEVETKLVSTLDTFCFMEIAVRDTGQGLTERQLDDLFQDLEQVVGEEDPTFDTSGASIGQDTTADDSTASSHIGLGLAMVARFIQLRDGQLRMKSQKGRGTIVTLDIPWLMCTEPVSSLSTPEFPSTPSEEPLMQQLRQQTSSLSMSGATNSLASQAEASNEKSMARRVQEITSPTSPLYSNEDTTPSYIDRVASMVVAIADDNSINLQVLKRRLEMMGHTVFSGRDGRECFDIFRDQQDNMQFVLMDIDMPLVDGTESTRMIRELEQQSSASRRVPIFAVSASLRKEDERNFVANGFDGWLLKPIDFRRLNLLLAGAFVESMKRDGYYHPDRFHMGGWFDMAAGTA